MTMSVTASLGSFPPEAVFLRPFDLVDFRAFGFRLAIVAGIVAQNAFGASNT